MIRLQTPTLPPTWALLERHLLDSMGALARAFVQRYTRPDGTLVWREEWLGMDGSDDAYESFFNFPLLASLNGDMELDALARAEWEAITRQFTAYGQVYREFDAYYDWMHHGESSLLLYYFGLNCPHDLRFRARSLRFAGMYNGEDPEAQNYDPVKKLIRSPITGSRGPRFENSAVDWLTHREILANYPSPFPDIQGVPEGTYADWNDDAVFEKILRLLNARMMRGDVPLNLTATSMMVNAFLYSGEEKYKAWVLDYLGAWAQRAEQNGGFLPDNVGLSGEVGECMGGKWYGGYYGWRWPHGFMSLIEPASIAGANALLLTGETRHLDLPRQQLDLIFQQGKEMNGVFSIPHRYAEHGWYDYRPLHTVVHQGVPPGAEYPIYLWYLSMEEEDRERVELWRGQNSWRVMRAGRGKGDNIHSANWYAYMQGDFPDYPEAILRTNLAEVHRRSAVIMNDTSDPETWDIHHWQDVNPVVCEGLVQLMLGAPNAIYHGGLLHCRLRYFDPVRGLPGVPPDVAVCVQKMDAESITVEMINLHPMEVRVVVVQAGGFAEHRFSGAEWSTPSGDHSEAVEAKWVTVEIAPGCGGTLRFAMQRFVNTPTYAHPKETKRGC